MVAVVETPQCGSLITEAADPASMPTSSILRYLHATGDRPVLKQHIAEVAAVLHAQRSGRAGAGAAAGGGDR